MTAFLQIGSTSAGCPLSHLHESAEGGVSIANPHIALANQHSLQVHKTPLVHFKIPPKDRHHSSAAPGFEIVMEGGVLVEKKKKENKDGKKKKNDRDLQELKQIKQEWDLLDIMSPESTLDEPSYSNQNVGDGFAKPVGGYSAVRQDVIDMVLTNNQAFWPADILPPGTYTSMHVFIYKKKKCQTHNIYRFLVYHTTPHHTTPKIAFISKNQLYNSSSFFFSLSLPLLFSTKNTKHILYI